MSFLRRRVPAVCDLLMLAGGLKPTQQENAFGGGGCRDPWLRERTADSRLLMIVDAGEGSMFFCHTRLVHFAGNVFVVECSRLRAWKRATGAEQNRRLLCILALAASINNPRQPRMFGCRGCWCCGRIIECVVFLTPCFCRRPMCFFTSAFVT